MFRHVGWRVLPAALVIAVGCSKGGGEPSDSSRGGNRNGSGGHAIADNGAGKGGGGDFFNSNGGSPEVASEYDGGRPDAHVRMHDEDAALDMDNACGVGTAMAELTPVNMFVMFDRSKSMNDNDKWINATAALS